MVVRRITRIVVGVNWAAGFMRWKPFVDSAGVAYPLNHLHPFRFVMKFEAKGSYSPFEVDVHVGFAMHAFTRKINARDELAHIYEDDREKRLFDFERYRYSKLLPGIVRALATRKCYYAKHQNFLTIDFPSPDASDAEYHVFFVVCRWQEKTRETGALCVRLVVQSAYLARAGSQVPRGRREKPIGFRVLLSRALGKNQISEKRKPRD